MLGNDDRNPALMQADGKPRMIVDAVSHFGQYFPECSSIMNSGAQNCGFS